MVFETALGVLALILGWTLGPDARTLIPTFSESMGSIFWGIGWGFVAAIPILVIIEVIGRIPCEPVRALERLREDPIFTTLLSLGIGELILISICAGVGEELLFRGWLLYYLAGASGMEPSTIEIGAALVMSSIAFGLVHPFTKLYIFLGALMGLYFGGLLLWSENLLIPIVAHAAYDAVLLIMAKREKQQKRQSQTESV